MMHCSENVKFAILNIRRLSFSLVYLERERERENSENLEKFSPLELRKTCITLQLILKLCFGY